MIPLPKLSGRAIAEIIAGALAVVVLLLLAFCRAPAPHDLPPDLQKKVIAHEVQTVIDTASIHRLERAADTARAAQRRDSVQAAKLKVTAANEKRRADSLSTVAAAATTARDSAIAYHAALDARTAEAETLTATVAVQDSVIRRSTEYGDSLRVALTTSERRATRADSVIAAAVTVVKRSDPPCTFAHFFSCPSRGEVALGAGVTGVALGIVGKIAYDSFIHSKP